MTNNQLHSYDVSNVSVCTKREEISRTEYTVSQISNVIKGTLEQKLYNVYVKGEISDYKIAQSGHVYFSLKDSNAILKGACWRQVAAQLDISWKQGLEVVCYGNISTYTEYSSYQLIVKHIEVSGVGALLLMLEKLRKALAAEGLFDEKRKKRIPGLPIVIGIVTSPTGAVIRDMLHRITERCPVHVIVWEVLVQGKEAPGEIEKAIRGFNTLPDNIPRPDVLIVARGGGSIEDLGAFNEERVVRAVADSTIPIISGIGHETDTTLIDHAADVRAPTPTAAAEIAVPVLHELRRRIEELYERLRLSLPNTISAIELRLEKASSALLNVEVVFRTATNKLAELSLKNRMITEQYLRLHETKLSNYYRLLNSADYRTVLSRGFALLKGTEPYAKPIRSIQQLGVGQSLVIELADGISVVTVISSVPKDKR
ncbi:exodeoxyribonuclease VII large subunit [Rickettsiales endosymbiont of Peranema trichophorum]|uniref:exodeoxyribonuclease VII large subunit n=1 Tax=Rickettsiales endosymbiont of Peranema trichophorum TaxID=2486577 RepID=UPI001023D89A|nr:exodeoxyribonuclease VII large subunit [Rickettsiales endosymbiont of Peranema trichophorum]RZI47449.1 exodeoxyribonuclease VII large subunit [Rickettsiales endosymbiont of Peranema trichophorum]